MASKNFSVSVPAELGARFNDAVALGMKITASKIFQEALEAVLNDFDAFTEWRKQREVQDEISKQG